MPPTLTDDIRQAYLDFFEVKNHAVIPGTSLIPENDPTVLFTTAGMHPLVPYLLGEPHPEGQRLASCQKCVRTQDIDEVGDESHLTFFEMLGNWSLGDYFKEEAIQLSFEFFTEILEIPLQKLAITCFAGDKDAPKDEESANIWKKFGIPSERIGFLPKKDNWWGPAGKTGPCGPDTEMFYWIGEGNPKGNPATHPPSSGSGQASDWLEIWNDVFMQYNKNVDGIFTSLKQKNVDTGMGLERVAQVLQGVESVYETDRMKPIFKVIQDCVVSGSTPLTMTRHIRIIVDHLKAATFIIADGVEPSNVDRGYILRRLIRRAIRSAKQLGIKTNGSFCPDVADVIHLEYLSVYPELNYKLDEIFNILKKEEQQFHQTLTEGLKHFKKMSGPIDGITAFHLYDTYGFPLELTKELAAEKGQTVDEAGFAKAFEEHQKLSRKGAEKKFAGGLADHSAETTKLHTATHLLNAALRKVLGNHVQQKGSNITAERLRFDFNHPDKLTPEQIKEVEHLVNDAIKKNEPVSYHITTVDGAKKEGAIGVFDERYGQEVKVYVVGDGTFSKEICGGPHVARTGMIGTFKIIKEESSSAGIRRIKAVVEGGPEEIDVAKEEQRA
ncbi:alanine--tRNA ligase [Candidatus Peregrinibacteria bacterium]|nr:alanine--tRNA ligase [Candidatus Peregrinibacteria bacterium]